MMPYSVIKKVMAPMRPRFMGMLRAHVRFVRRSSAKNCAGAWLA
jgi:hypothetical protein